MNDQLHLILEDVFNGIPIVIVDDETRENEGDLVLSAEKVTEENLAFFIREARGLMCLPTTSQILDSLELPMMVEKSKSTDKNGTPFTVSVDASDDIITTGMPVSERVITISKFVKGNLNPDDLSRPGHIFPLRARDGLLKERRGHTEASVVLMLIAKLKPAAVIAEIINDNGSMARGESLDQFILKHNLKKISVQEIEDAYDSSQLQ